MINSFKYVVLGFALMLSGASGASGDGARTKSVCVNSTGTHYGLFYTFWNDGGESCITLSGGGYSVDYALSPSYNLVAGIGWRKGSSNRRVGYNAKSFVPGNNSYLTLYGWTTNPLIEYYVVDNWGAQFTPPDENAALLGTVTTDGGVYNIYRTQRVNAPSIRGTTTFYQFWSVRTEKRETNADNVITFANHVAAWRTHGMMLGTMDYQVMATEGFGSDGRSDLTVWKQK